MFNAEFSKSRLLPTDRIAWSDRNGVKSKPLDQIECLPGYYWDGNWEIDKSEKTDKDGWIVDF